MKDHLVLEIIYVKTKMEIVNLFLINLKLRKNLYGHMFYSLKTLQPLIKILWQPSMRMLQLLMKKL